MRPRERLHAPGLPQVPQAHGAVRRARQAEAPRRVHRRAPHRAGVPFERGRALARRARVPAAHDALHVAGHQHGARRVRREGVRRIRLPGEPRDGGVFSLPLGALSRRERAPRGVPQEHLVRPQAGAQKRASARRVRGRGEARDVVRVPLERRDERQADGAVGVALRAPPELHRAVGASRDENVRVFVAGERGHRVDPARVRGGDRRVGRRRKRRRVFRRVFRRARRRPLADRPVAPAGEDGVAARDDGVHPADVPFRERGLAQREGERARSRRTTRRGAASAAEGIHATRRDADGVRSVRTKKLFRSREPFVSFSYAHDPPTRSDDVWTRAPRETRERPSRRPSFP